MKLLFTFLSLRFFDMRRERETISFHAEFSIWPPPCAAPLPQTTGLASASSENRLPFSSVESQLQLTQPTRGARSARCRLASPRSESRLTVFFSNSKILRFRTWRHSRPRSYFLSGVLIVTSLIVTSAPRALEHLHLTYIFISSQTVLI